MSKRAFIFSCCAVLALPTVSVAQSSRKKPTAQPVAPAAKPSLAQSLTGPAKEAYEAGVLAYNDGAYAGAISNFQRAYDESKDPRLLWNIAAAEKQQRHYAKARLKVRQYAELSTDLSEAEKQEAAELIAMLDNLVADVKFTVNEADASIVVDGVEVAQSPVLEPISLDAGTRSIRVSKAGFAPYETSLKLTGGGAPTDINVTLAAQTNQGRIAVRASEAGAAIVLDNQSVGTGSYSGLLASGTHELRVTHDGFKPYSITFSLAENGTRSFDVNLERSKKAVPVWAIVVGGALATGLLVTGGYFLFRPKDEQTPLQPGTFPPYTVNLSGAKF